MDMKIGRKGFMLAEVVVVAVVVATVLVTLYAGLSNVSSAYDTRNRYYDVDSLYAAMDINDILIRNDSSLIKTDQALALSSDDSVVDFENFFKETDDSISSYIAPYDKDIMLSLKTINNKATFGDYLDYLSGNLNFDDDYDYMIIVERLENNDIDDCYYYALKLKY